MVDPTPSQLVELIARAIHDALYVDKDSGAWLSGKCPLDSVTVDGDVDLLNAAHAVLPIIATAQTAAAKAAIEACRDAQPVTPMDPTESDYWRGRFEGVIEYGKAISKLDPTTFTGGKDA